METVRYRTVGGRWWTGEWCSFGFLRWWICFEIAFVLVDTITRIYAVHPFITSKEIIRVACYDPSWNYFLFELKMLYYHWTKKRKNNCEYKSNSIFLYR
jgi:hypothetical protein